ncbi:MAG: hypothetical protein UHH87_00045, partial [Akkermansia sp.]|nr:hypothetical protein [Akkermansia sp.]
MNFQGETAVTLGEDISAGCINIASGADVSINLADYELAAERIALSGTLDVGEPLVIGEGVTLAVESSSAVLKSGLILTENGTLNMDAAADLSGASLSLQKGTVLTLTDSFLASGDGCVYELFTNVGTLQRTNGSTLQLSDDTLYYFFFDISS